MPITTTTIRTTIATLAAAFIVAVAVVPAAQALPTGGAIGTPTTSGGVAERHNDNRFQKSSAQLKQEQWGVICGEMSAIAREEHAEATAAWDRARAAQAKAIKKPKNKAAQKAAQKATDKAKKQQKEADEATQDAADCWDGIT
jgi:hypothetical protein